MTPLQPACDSLCNSGVVYLNVVQHEFATVQGWKESSASEVEGSKPERTVSLF